MISDILDSNYVKEDGSEPNYIITKDGKKISRVNIIAIVISKDSSPEMGYKRLSIDDGSGVISARLFDENPGFDKISVGDIALIIGKPRLYGSELYIVPEIITKQEMRWFELRKKELGFSRSKTNASDDSNKARTAENPEVSKTISKTNTLIGKAAEFEYAEDNYKISDYDNMIGIIRQNDSSEGVLIEDIVNIIKKPNSEKMIDDMLKNGDIFMVKPGRVRVL
jgi:RPA family protein